MSNISLPYCAVDCEVLETAQTVFKVTYGVKQNYSFLSLPWNKKTG